MKHTNTVMQQYCRAVRKKLPLPARQRRQLLAGLQEELAESAPDCTTLDALIAQYAVRWNLHRISRLTKAAMRLAIYEMRYVDDVPNGVAINECVELTRKYEDAQVVSFVNGILGSVARGAKPNTEASADPQPEEAQPEETPSEETQPAPEEAQQP